LIALLESSGEENGAYSTKAAVDAKGLLTATGNERRVEWRSIFDLKRFGLEEEEGNCSWDWLSGGAGDLVALGSLSGGPGTQHPCSSWFLELLGCPSLLVSLFDLLSL